MTTSRTSRDGEQGVAPVQVRGPVLTVRRIDAFHALTMVAPAIASRFRPGQFVTVAVGGPESSMLLRRAFTVHDVRPDHGGTVEFVFTASEPGTRWLARRRSRDMLDAVGPLAGRSPSRANPRAACWSGPGSPARRCSRSRTGCVSAAARSTSCSARKARTTCSARCAHAAPRAARRSPPGTGRWAHAGSSPTCSARSFTRPAATSSTRPAPLPVLREVTALAGRYDIPVQACVQEAMGCGTGVCMSCVLPVVGSDGITRIVRSCVDGPVFRGDVVRWDDVGTIPFDALGAPGWKPPRAPREAPADHAAAQLPHTARQPQIPRPSTAARPVQHRRPPQARCRLTCGPGSATSSCRTRSSPPPDAREPAASWRSSSTWPRSAPSSPNRS